MINQSVARLQSLHESDRAVLELIAGGERNLPGLRDFLLNGRLTSVFQPRLNAVNAIAGIGGKDILIEYLKSPLRTGDPVIRLGEEAVRSSAVRELSRWPAEEVADAIMDSIRKHLTPGACDAAGRLRLISAAPYLVDALADDICRLPAMDALRSMFPEVKPLLIETALRFAQLRFPDSPTLLRRAQAALRILSEVELSEADAVSLSPLVAANDSEIAVCVSRILITRIQDHRQEIASVLVRNLGRAPWFLRDEIRELLDSCGVHALPALDFEIEMRSTPEGRDEPASAAHDDVLSTLINIRSRIRSRA